MFHETERIFFFFSVPSVVSFGSGVDERSGVERQDVEITFVPFVIHFDPSLTFGVVDQLSDVFLHEIPFLNILQRLQSPSAVGRFKSLRRGITALLKPLVLTFVFGRTRGRMTFVHQHPVKTFFVGAARRRIRLIGFALADGQLGGVDFGDANVAVRHVGFDEAIFGGLLRVVHRLFLVVRRADRLVSRVSLRRLVQSRVEILFHLFVVRDAFARGIAFLVSVRASHVQPVVIVAAQEMDGELTHLMVPLLDVVGNVTRVTNLGRPPGQKENDKSRLVGSSFFHQDLEGLWP